MTESMTVIQARLSEQDARQVDQDAQTLGLRNRSEAVRAGLRLLHRRAAQQALAREYDDFYGAGSEAPISDVTSIGDQLAADTMQSNPQD